MSCTTKAANLYYCLQFYRTTCVVRINFEYGVGMPKFRVGREIATYLRCVHGPGIGVRTCALVPLCSGKSNFNARPVLPLCQCLRLSLHDLMHAQKSDCRAEVKITFTI